jgi:cytoskeleton protein RodZ
MANPGSDGWNVAAIRSTKGISLEEIASDTKLKVSTLKAIETADFEALPGGIYNISYIRQYARAIGIDEGSLVELYRKKSTINPQSLAS